ncbi:MAG: hypothetical protein ACOZE5_13760 [Verrucomicrobiota bacterium]
MKHPLVLLGGLCTGLGALLAILGLARVGERPARLTWSAPEVKSALMTAGYKVYGNRNIEEGRHYLSKIVFKNDGERPVTGFAISYKIDDYIEWTEPTVRREIPAGFSFVELYYPRLPAAVSQLRNAVTTTLRTRIRWTENGREREENIARDITLRAVNEIAYCDVPQSEAVLFTDYFSAAAFTMTMVTPNDPVVTLYTSEITRLAGGTTAGIAGGPDEVKRICAIIYDYMGRTGLRYVGDSGVPSNFDNIASMVQTVRLPRDVIVNNQGLCIELSLLWCSILEHLGVRSAMILVPGHAFVVAYSPDQGMPLAAGLPIECTAITPRAVGKDAPVPFAEAVQMAAQTVQHWAKDGRIIPLEVQKIQAYGFTPPELPEIDTARLAETLAARLGRGASVAMPMPADMNAAAAPAPLGDDSPAPAPLEPDDRNVGPSPAPDPGTGARGYRDPEGRYTLEIMPGWRAESVGNGAVAIANGESSIFISPFSGVRQAEQVLIQLYQQLQPQFRNFQPLSQDIAGFGGRRAVIARYTGISPKGTLTRLSLAGVDASAGPAYGIIVSMPLSLYESIRGSVDQMLRSFQFAP